MFNSRVEVDKHVENCLKRINNEKERNLRSLSFAKLYYKVGDYQQARRYVQMYLNLKSTSAEAQHLLGNCLEKLGQKEAAADAYRSSLSLDPTQTSLILKLCQLLAENDMDLDSLDSGALYYCERAQSLDPGNQYVQQLREKLLARSSRDPNEVTQLLIKEIENRPSDAECAVRLLKHLSNNNQVKLAVNHIHLTHTSNLNNLASFLRHLSYVSTSADILLRYHRENAVAPSLSVTTANNPLTEENQPLNWQFWMLLITTLDALVALTGADLTGTTEKKGYIWNMWMYDQMVLEAIKAMGLCPDKQLTTTFLLHQRGQVCFHLVTLLFRQARLGLLRWREAVSAALPLIFSGYHAQPPDTTALWLEHATGLGSGLKGTKKGNDIVYDAKELVKRWNVEASNRCAQLGYVLYALGKDRKIEMVERAKQGTTGLWREQLYKKLFLTRDYQSKMKSSFFTTTTDLMDISLRLPEPQTLRTYASVAQLQYPDSLHHLIWLYLHQHRTGKDVNVLHSNGSITTISDLSVIAQYGGGVVAIAELTYPMMGGSLPLSVKNLGNCAAETLNVLDIQSFVYCATLCCGDKAEKTGGNKFEEQDRPPLLPAAITEQLGSTNQINWLKAAFRVQKGECYFGGGSDKNELRLTLIRGIEVIRCVGNHGIDVAILVQLAKVFQTRSKNLKSHSEIEFNEARAELYWKAAMPLLERLKNKHSISYSTKRLFETQNKQLLDDEVQDAIESGKLFYGVMYLKKKELERALAQFKNLKDPYSSYYQAQIYEVMADDQMHGRKNNITAHQRAQSLILLTQARDCLYLTLDRLRDPSVDRNHPLNSVLSNQIESVERTLARWQGDLDGQGDGHHLEDTEIKEEGDEDGESMVTARDILSKSLLNSSLNQSYLSASHHMYSTPISHHTQPSNAATASSNRQQLFAPSSPAAALSTLRRDEARPSPERLDAQLRQLTLARDATNAQLVEQNRAVLETHRALLLELKGLREGVNELKGIRPAFDELKNAVEDLQSLRNLPDMVHEMKREIADLKSNSKQQNQQITDEDLYNALEEEYGADFANSMPNTASANTGLNNSIAAAALGGSLYQNLPRMAAAAAAAAAAGPAAVQQMSGLGYNPAAAAAAAAAAAGLYHPGIYPGIYSPYGGLSITQGSLPFMNPAPGTGPVDPHHTGLGNLGDYRNPLTHPQVAHHTYPGPPPSTAPPISSNIALPPLSYPPPTPATFGNLQQQQQQQYPTNTTMVPSPLGGLGGVQLSMNMFKDNPASIGVPPAGSKSGFGGIAASVVPHQQQQQTTVSQGLSGVNLFGGGISTAPVSTVGGIVSTTSTGFGGLSFGNLPTSGLAFTVSSASSPSSMSKPAPVNVVITASDPLPTPTTTQSPILSVIIPPQHIKQSKQHQHQPHNYQIPLPASGALSAPPSVLNQPVGIVNPQGMLANVGPPMYSAVGDRKDRSMDGNRSFGGDEHNRSNLSSASVEDHDAQPDFKPIIPLPDEVEVVTGEEDEKVLFCARGKLHRYMEKDWKERGIGDIKLLQNKEGKVRILMRRERVHKICANHYITGDMQFGPKAKLDTAYVWVANDFADETVTLEKFCIRFKTADVAKAFAVQFEKAQEAVKLQESAPKDTLANTSAGNNLGGFVFSSTPSFKPKEQHEVTTPILSKPVESTKSSPFAGFTFNTTPKSDSKTSTPVKPDSATKSPKAGSAGDFVPTAEFIPVIPLPELVHVKSGEENCEVLFESHSKLLRYDTTNKDWKERGIGQMKIIKDNNIVRLLMRREQVFKVCCNHQLFKSIDFSKMPNSPRVINWYAKDYSDGVLELQMFALKFRNEELANAFLEAIDNAKKLLDSSSNLLVKQDQKVDDFGEHEKKVKTSTTITPTKASGFGDKFKLKSGSWTCKNCYIHNEGKDNYCVACETPKNDSVPKKSEETANVSFGARFSFGIPNSTGGPNTALSGFSSSVSKSTASTNVTNSSTTTSSFGNAFKPEEGSWECKECYVRNKPSTTSCSSCTTPKEGANLDKPPVSAVVTNTNLPSGLTFMTAADAGNTTQTQFSFGFPSGNAAGGFTFGSATGPNPTTTASSFTFLSTPASISYTPVTSTASATSADFTFGSSSAHTFEFQPRHSPRKHSSNSMSGQSLDGSNSASAAEGGEHLGAAGDGTDDSYVHEEEEDNIYFKPVIPLPDEVAVVTGEENETAVYEQRAKLYRFVDGQWKERGTGNIKLLITEGTDKARAVMRREHVHKVCLNHAITPEISYTVKTDKSWQFAAADFSEGDIEYLQFCLRFRTAEIALEFKAAIDDVIGRISGDGSGDAISSGAKPLTKSSSDSDVVFISETQVTEEERIEALKLKLPPKFMVYRQLPDCACEQCKKDDLYYKADNKATTAALTNRTVTSTASNVPTSTTESLRDLIQKPPSFFFGQPTATTAPPATSTGPSTIFGGVAIFGNTSTDTTTPKANPFAQNNLFSASSGPSTNLFDTTATTRSGASTNLFSAIATSGASTNVFGSTTTVPKALFGTPTTTTATTFFGTTTNSLFGSPAISNTSIFGGGNTPKIAPASTNLFNLTPAPTGTNIFGAASAAKPTEPIFGSTSTNKSIFNTPASTANLFGTPTNNLTTSSTGSSGSIFGSSVVSTVAPTTTNLFGTPSTTTTSTGLFGLAGAATKPTSTIFGGSTNVDESPLFSVKSNIGGTKEPTVTTAATVTQPPSELMFSASDSMTFASLAATTGTAAAAFKTDSTFEFANAGAPVFGKARPRPAITSTTSNTTQDGTDDDAANTSGNAAEDAVYDPHYEPIVPLPDEIVVSTGEENEEVMFSERSKLFRYNDNTKEWKERGVGNIKLLFNPQTGVYRLLLRRELVHKIVLNCRVTKDLNLQPMNKSETSYIWIAHNFLEETGTVEQEKLAVKFKNIDLACQFYRKVQETMNHIEKLSKQAESKPKVEVLVQPTQSQSLSTILSSASAAHSGVSFSQPQQNVNYGDEDDEESDDGDDVDEEYDDDKNIMSSKPCKLAEQLPNGNIVILGDGLLQLFYDEDYFGTRISFTEPNGTLLSNTLIGMNTEMTHDGNQCRWTSVEWAHDPPAFRNLIATFNTLDDAEECYVNYKEGISYAQQSDIQDILPTHGESYQ